VGRASLRTILQRKGRGQERIQGYPGVKYVAGERFKKKKIKSVNKQKARKKKDAKYCNEGFAAILQETDNLGWAFLTGKEGSPKKTKDKQEDPYKSTFSPPLKNGRRRVQTEKGNDGE